MKTSRAVVGFRVKSGWAVCALIGESARSPSLRDSVAIDLSDPLQPETRQPYHAAMGKLETNAAKLKRRKASVRRATDKSTGDLLERHFDSGYAIDRAGIVVGSVIDPDQIANPHIRAHALEAQLFRTTLQAALEARGIRCLIFRERDMYENATKLFRLASSQIARRLIDLGRSAKGPWRADQKMAALAAWMILQPLSRHSAFLYSSDGHRPPLQKRLI